MFRAIRHLVAALALSTLAVLALAPPARALPSFATQTGQPCTACHIGSFGPQLTPFGRAFKIAGYTQTGGQGWQSAMPVSALFLGSFTNTNAGQSPPPATHYSTNNNFAMDQISLYLAGRVSDDVGGFVQTTFDGIDSTGHLDNTDLHVSHDFDVGDTDLRFGMDVNNGPTVQDPYNSTYAWGFPYAASALAPTPTAQPLLAGALIGNSIGTTLYGWYDRSLYLEAGLYNTFGPTLLSLTGNAYGPGSTSSPAPYLRAAYEWNWNGQSAWVGGMFMHADINPAVAAFEVNGSNGHDSYTDYAIDGGYQFLGDGTNVVAVTGIYDHEQQQLNSSFATGAASQSGNRLDQVRANLTYYYQQTYGFTVGWQYTTGTANPALYAPAPISGSANGKPNSNAFILEADWVPFGKSDSFAAPWVNLKIGLQYTIYTEFNGGTTNYDGYGRNASDNNTLYLFGWMMF